MNNRIDVRIQEIHHRTQQYKQKYNNCAIYIMSTLSIFLLSGICILLKSLHTYEAFSMSKGYCSLLLYENAGAYTIVGTIAFVAGAILTIIHTRLKQKKCKQLL